jgi:hypothetical protein
MNSGAMLAANHGRKKSARSMIRKSGYRFSEKIMLEKKDKAGRLFDEKPSRAGPVARVKAGHQAQKNAAFPEGTRRFVAIITCKEELLCPWQAWQRPTLPGLKP